MRFIRIFPIYRLGEMAEVAGAVTFLASRDAAFVNASDLKVLVLNIAENV